MQIKGKDYQFRFKYKALRSFLLKTGLKLSDLGDETIMTIHAPEMLYFGLKAGQEFFGETFDLTLEQIVDWIEEDTGNLNSALSALNQDAAVAGE